MNITTLFGGMGGFSVSCRTVVVLVRVPHHSDLMKVLTFNYSYIVDLWNLCVS